MLDQNYLNSLSLADASAEISLALINERISLKEQKAELDSLKEKYQHDYIVANDGDSSENAPLEQAIQNLKTITGDIVAVVKKSQTLDKIEDSVYVTAVYDYDKIVMDTSAMSPDSIRVLLNIFEIESIDKLPDRIKSMSKDDLFQAVVQFDAYYGQTMANIIRSEYPEGDDIWKSRAALSSVVDGKLNEGVMAQEYKVLLDFEHIKTMKSVRPYNYCGVIVMYTTVRLDLDGRVFTYKIYPRGLSFIDDGVIAANARLATALMGRHVGDVVSIRNSSKGQILNYKVLEIY